MKTKLEIYREAAGLSQRDLARASGVHYNTINRIECGIGSTDKLTLLTACKLADVLGVAASDLLDKPYELPLLIV